MKFMFYILAAILLLLGLIFIFAGSYPIMYGRIAVGVILFVAGIAFIFASRMQPQVKEVQVTEIIELTGDISLENLTCRSCSAALKKEDISIKAGVVFIVCPYCSATYQMEEEPKW